jgi:hypothetical protein
MRALITALLSIAVVMPLRSQQAAVDAKTRAELERARDVVWRSWFAGDTATLDRVLAGALAAGDSNDGWSDRRRAIADSREFARSGGKLIDLTFDSTKIELHGPVAVMTGIFTYTTSDRSGKRDTSRGHVVEIFVFEKGAWTHPLWYLAR